MKKQNDLPNIFCMWGSLDRKEEVKQEFINRGADIGMLQFNGYNSLYVLNDGKVQVIRGGTKLCELVLSTNNPYSLPPEDINKEDNIRIYKAGEEIIINISDAIIIKGKCKQMTNHITGNWESTSKMDEILFKKGCRVFINTNGLSLDEIIEVANLGLLL